MNNIDWNSIILQVAQVIAYPLAALLVAKLAQLVVEVYGEIKRHLSPDITRQLDGWVTQAVRYVEQLRSTGKIDPKDFALAKQAATNIVNGWIYAEYGKNFNVGPYVDLISAAIEAAVFDLPELKQ